MAAPPEEKLLQLAAWVERAIYYSLLGTLFLVVAVQLVLSNPQAQHWLYSHFGDTPEPLPAMAMGMGEAGEDAARIKVKLLGHQALRHAYVLVDERRITNFIEAEVEIVAAEDEEVAIDALFQTTPHLPGYRCLTGGLKSLPWTGGYLLGTPGKPGEGKAKPILTLGGGMGNAGTRYQGSNNGGQE